MTASCPRRRVLCVRAKANPATASFLRDVNCEWITALGRHADVHVMAQDFDLKAACDEFSPDFIIFDSVNWSRPWPVQVTNAQAYPSIPRVLLLNIDPHEPFRPLVYDLLSHLRIGTIFQHSGPCHAHFMPELKHLTSFTIPHFVDESVFRDYELAKIIPVSIFSAHLLPLFYDWRAQITEGIQRIFPTLLFPHPGYAQGQSSAFAVQGEAYARLINQSAFSAADTTRLDYVVRKHLEIPAAGAVLVAPESAALGEYGFKDDENCLLGSGPDLFAKIDAVSRQPERYATIKAAGHALVHGRYTRGTWRYILDWFECQAKIGPGERVEQHGVFASFAVTRTSLPAVDTVPVRDNQMTAILREARRAILTGRNLETAASDLKQASTWAEHIAEPFFMLGMIALLLGQPGDGALAIARRASGLGQLDPALVRFDPVEIAWITVAATLIGQDGLVQAMREQAALTRHLALRRVAWMLSGTKDDPLGRDRGLHERRPDDVPSIHWLGQEDFETWCDIVRRVCTASHRIDLIPKPRTMRLAG